MGESLSTRPVPDELWKWIGDELFRGTETRVFGAVVAMNPYSYDPKVREQLRRLADSAHDRVRRAAIGILKRQHSVDTGSRFCCAACALLDPTQTRGDRLMWNANVPEYSTVCTSTGDFVWPTTDKCPKYAAASQDLLYRDRVRRNKLA